MKEYPFMPADPGDNPFGPPSEWISSMDWQGTPFMPGRDDIPEEFLNLNSRTGWNQLFGTWFFSGLPKDTVFYPKEGIDPDLALKHVGVIMRSWAPKHEHKEAACAYLLSLWFDDVKSGGKSLLK